jgi:tetratricopeptide (TPR) repeat protein
MPGGSLARLNTAIDGLIAMGRYRAALAMARGWQTRGADTESELLVQINLAEAEYNLGDWSAAWERLRGLDPLAAAFPIARAGLSQQRAWIAAHTDHPEEALHHWQRAELRDLPRRYHAEHWFTGAVALAAAGDLDGALRCAARGSGAAVRPSSRRNALIIQARIAAAEGDWPRAEPLCRAAAGHPYRGQGADGLLLWGDALVRLGRLDDARRAFALATERDPESVHAHTARERLAAEGVA